MTQDPDDFDFFLFFVWQLETVFSVNVLQFIFLSLRLDKVILWSWVVSRYKFLNTIQYFQPIIGQIINFQVYFVEYIE